MTAPAKNTKLYIAGGFLLALALLVFAQQAFNLTLLSPSQPDEIYLLSTLSAVVFLVVALAIQVFTPTSTTHLFTPTILRRRSLKRTRRIERRAHIACSGATGRALAR